ncbi:MAG: Maf family protein [Eubacteriaceae bacterium]|nr:Maf family protein [Eubacteriaceae bacterium]
MDHKFILASGSPRRIEMMEENSFPVLVMPSDIEEHIPDFLTPEEAVMFLAMSKAMDVKNRLDADRYGDDNPVITAADTVVVFEDQILGKPKDRADALAMLVPMSGKSHRVMTGVAISFTDRALTFCFCETSKVYFKEMPEEEILQYVKTAEPYDKAGGYAVQETFSKYIDHIEGDRDNIIGFPWKRFRDTLDRLLSD